MDEKELEEIKARFNDAHAGITNPKLDLVELVSLMTIASSRIPALIQAIRDRDKKIATLEIKRDSDLYAEFGDGKIWVGVLAGNKIVFSKRHGTGVIGTSDPSIKTGDYYAPKANDIVFKFKNIEALKVVKWAIEEVEKDIVKQQAEGDST